MSEFVKRPEDSRGYVVSVPEGNGYTVALFTQRIKPHIENLGLRVFVPGLASAEDGEGKMFDDKRFGVEMSASGDSYGEVYRKFDQAEGVITTHYGLRVTSAKVSHTQDFKRVFTAIKR